MAVKASAHITLHSVVDIQATYRYYLLQSSTLSKPSVPTTNPPTGSWDDSEPTYTAGSTNSLYFVDLTVFSNGTFKYSEVSLSTAYEAAKEAYNKAVAAQGSIDGLEIGGRNYMLSTSNEWSEDLTVTGWQLYTYKASSAAFTDLIGQTITFSGYIRNISGPEVGIMITIYTPDDANTYIQAPSSDKVAEGATGYVQYTYTIPDTVQTITDIQLAIRHYSLEDADTTVNIKSWKLEKGNRPTDWTAAPEDMEAALGELGAETSSNTTRLNDAQLSIDSLNATISSLITGQNGESLMTQTDSGWTFCISNIQNALDSATTNIGELDENLSNANSVIDSLTQTVTDLGVKAEYVEIGVENGKPCIILGETDSVFKVVITNTDIRFMEGSAVPASISNQSLNIEKAVIKDELKQGGFAWVTRSNGNYGLIWKGDD